MKYLNLSPKLRLWNRFDDSYRCQCKNKDAYTEILDIGREHIRFETWNSILGLINMKIYMESDNNGTN